MLAECFEGMEIMWHPDGNLEVFFFGYRETQIDQNLKSMGSFCKREDLTRREISVREEFFISEEPQQKILTTEKN